MTVTQVDIIPSKTAENIQAVQYTSNDIITVIDKFTATNIGLTHATLSINIVTSGDIASISNLILNEVTIEPGATYKCPEVVGHVLSSGGFISTKASSFPSIVIRSSGRQISVTV